MTIETFLEELERVSTQFQWMLMPDEDWASERRSDVRFRIRGAPLMGRAAKHRALDPLTAVCHARSGKRNSNRSWNGDDLGLTRDDQERIVAAANDRTQHGETGRRQPDPGLIILRTRLLKAVGLSVPKPLEN